MKTASCQKFLIFHSHVILPYDATGKGKVVPVL